MRTLLAVAALLLASRVSAAPAWTPDAWANESTLQLRTTAKGEGPHWFPVWLAVVDGQLYVRLGSKAAWRIENNETAPFVGVRIAGFEFERVHGIPAPEKAASVAEVIAGKYWSDVFIRHASHPLTLRLLPE